MIPSGKTRCVIEVNSSPGFIIEKINDINMVRKIVRQAVSNANRQEKRAMEKLATKLNEPVKVPIPPLTEKLKPVPATLKKLKIRAKLAS
jgi:hypothetical protein